jgi:hypothetical protein
MPQYLIATYLPDDFDPSTVTQDTVDAIHQMNRDLVASGKRKFACGLYPASSARVLRKRADGKVLETDGPFTETKEHVGGLMVLEAANMEEVLEWARKGPIMPGTTVEVREIFFQPAPEPA